VPVTATHRDFAKTYWLDLVVGDAGVYELKTESRLALDHDAQLLNYLLLLNAHHGKLVNFRPAQVESRFVNTTLTPPARGQFEAETQRWRELDESTRLLRITMTELLGDWGGFLELPLYAAALTHFLGGEEKVRQMVKLSRGGVPLGNQRFLLLNPDTAFRLTALPEGVEDYEPQLRALLRLSPLRAIQWINLARHRVQFVTLEK